jgi:hypothetical protein
MENAMSRVFKIGLVGISMSLAACGAAAGGQEDQGASEEAVSASTRAAWLRDAEYAWASNFNGYPSATKVTRDELPGAAQKTFDRWAPNGNTPEAYEWTYKGRTGYYIFQVYNGSDSTIQAIFDAHGRHLATCDSPNGETKWSNADGTSYDPGIGGS